MSGAALGSDHLSASMKSSLWHRSRCLAGEWVE